MKAWVDHLQPEIAFAHVSESAHAPADRKRLLLARIEVEETQHELGLVVLDQAYELTPRSVLDLGVDNRAFDLAGSSCLDRRKRSEMRAVLVAHRQMQHEILATRDAEPRKLVGERVACFAFCGLPSSRHLAETPSSSNGRAGVGWVSCRVTREPAQLRLRFARRAAAPRPGRSRARDTAC